MMKQYKLIFALFLISTTALAQENTVITSDFESWSQIGVSKKLGDFTISLDENFRFNKNSTALDIFYTDLGISYKINKYIKLGSDYRFYRNKTNSGDYKTQHRFSGDVKFSYELKRFDFSYRMRLQNKDEDFYNSDLSDNNTYNFRNKIQIDYNIKKSNFNPYISNELFRIFGGSQEDYFNKIRLTAGCGYKIKKVGEIDLFYRIDKELNVSYPKTTYILGAGFTYKF